MIDVCNKCSCILTESNRKKPKSRSCADCNRGYNAAAMRLWRENNRDRDRSNARNWRNRNIEATRAANRKCWDKNKEKYKLAKSEWRSRNASYFALHAAERRALMKIATPKWADQDAMTSFYQEAAYLGMQIDHIIPIKNPIVCGLHWEGNLQALNKEDNQHKYNSIPKEVM